jgi:hypothetical protein
MNEPPHVRVNIATFLERGSVHIRCRFATGVLRPRWGLAEWMQYESLDRGLSVPSPGMCPCGGSHRAGMQLKPQKVVKYTTLEKTGLIRGCNNRKLVVHPTKAVSSKS